jgi:hypothetical protein
VAAGAADAAGESSGAEEEEEDGRTAHGLAQQLQRRYETQRREHTHAGGAPAAVKPPGTESQPVVLDDSDA